MKTFPLMNTHASRFVPALLVTLLVLAARPALATSTTFNGNGNTSFGGAVGNGYLTVTNDGLDFAAGTGFVDFTFVLGSGTFQLNDNIVIYLDNGLGGGISSTAQTTSTNSSDGGQCSVAQNAGPGGGGSNSILLFNSLMAPQYAIEFDKFNFGQIYTDTAGGSAVPQFIDGAGGNSTDSSNGLKYVVTGGTASINIPDADFGLPALSGTLELASMEVSSTGYSSGEGNETISGANGWGNTQTLQSVDTFVVVPEASTVGLVACGMAMLFARKRNWRLGRRA